MTSTGRDHSLQNKAQLCCGMLERLWGLISGNLSSGGSHGTYETCRTKGSLFRKQRTSWQAKLPYLNVCWDVHVWWWLVELLESCLEAYSSLPFCTLICGHTQSTHCYNIIGTTGKGYSTAMVYFRTLQNHHHLVWEQRKWWELSCIVCWHESFLCPRPILICLGRGMADDNHSYRP